MARLKRRMTFCEHLLDRVLPFAATGPFCLFFTRPKPSQFNDFKTFKNFFKFSGFTVGFCSIGIVAHFSSPPEPSNCFWSTEKFLKEHEKSRQPREVSYLDNLQNDTFLNCLEGHFQKQEGWEPDFQNDLSEIKLIWMWFQFPLIVGYQLYFFNHEISCYPEDISHRCKKRYLLHLSHFKGKFVIGVAST